MADLFLDVEVDIEPLEIQNKIISDCFEKEDNILKEMRNDLNVEVLNLTLYKRIQK
ncbi:MAG: hypothetical protein IPK31_07195 [Chitinophagaceae bacterium]|nr:hypothetical protein [Chitinophagaceae bacterium]